MKLQPVERLVKLGAKLDRSVNYLVVEAILQYLDREEKAR
jgi:predicted transcriptional regulator